MTETVLVIGAGIGGLCTALALGPTGRSITLLERDGTPPLGDADSAFRDWSRKGVGQLRQSHAFLARLGKIIKTDHPQLRQDLLDIGVRELAFDGLLTPMQKASYVPTDEDAELTILTSRRTTMELVIRRYVERMANVTIRSNIFVKSLLTDRAPDGTLTVRGVAAEDETGPVQLSADLIIDTGGKNGSAIEQLVAEGAPISEESETAGILYFTRHYKIRPGRSEPPREGNPPATGDLGYLKFGVFPADNGCFSITLCTPEIEYEMRKAIVQPDIWDAMVANIPGLKVWTTPDQAEAVSKVFGMGNLHSRWRRLVKGDKPAVLGFFAVGDSLIRTNPLYGRGCSFAAVEAYVLRDVLSQSADPATRMMTYDQRLTHDVGPYYQSMLQQDRSAMRRAEQALTPDYKPGLKSKMLKSFLEDAVTPAIRFDTNLLREAMRGFHMLEHPDAWLKRPRNLMRVLGYWARGKKRNAAGYPPKLGPEREAMLRALGLSWQADIALLAQKRRDDARAKTKAL
jgi:2-polyprenyl-6-methoxyphenol hydroxylase-like FAD-dependent oxidoreductase